MQLDIKQFEQVFKPAAIRKGLRFNQKEQVRLLPGAADRLVRMEVDEETLSFKRKSDTVSNISCSCGIPLCHHMAAVLIYLQRGTLNALLKRHVKQTGTQKSKPKPASATPFERSMREWKERTGRFHAKSGLSSSDALTIAEEMNRFLRGPDLFCRQLAVYVSAPQILQLRHASEQTELTERFKLLELRLAKALRDPLTAEQKHSLWEALRFAWRPQQNHYMEPAFFLLPSFLVHTRSLTQLETLKELVDKCKRKAHFFENIDPLLKARTELNIVIAHLSKTKAHGPPGLGAELFLAQAELLMWRSKPLKALRLLMENNEAVRTQFPAQYTDYLLFAAALAKNCRMEAEELFFLKKKILHNIFFDIKDLERAVRLVSKNERAGLYSELIESLKTTEAPYAIEKLAIILLHANRVDELMQLLNRQKGKFLLLHDLALKMWPVVPDNFLKLYSENLTQAMLQTSDPARQERLFETAGKYLDQLPGPYRESVLGKVRKLTLNFKF